MLYSMKKGFTLIELLVVVTILGFLSAMVVGSIQEAKDSTFLSRAKQEFHTMRTALEFYYDDHDGYPPDANRDLPADLNVYLAGESSTNWPKAPWPKSVYDWDNWDDPDNPGEKIYQISIRFCPAGGPLSECQFPDETWAAGFGVNSSVYYCVAGACRPHVSESPSYPGYCVNC